MNSSCSKHNIVIPSRISTSCKGNYANRLSMYHMLHNWRRLHLRRKGRGMFRRRWRREWLVIGVLTSWMMINYMMKLRKWHISTIVIRKEITSKIYQWDSLPRFIEIRASYLLIHSKDHFDHFHRHLQYIPFYDL